MKTLTNSMELFQYFINYNNHYGSKRFPKRIVEKWFILLTTLLLISGCAGGSGNNLQTYQFNRPLNQSNILKYQQDPRDPQHEFDISHLFGGIALDHEIPILTVDGRMDLVVVESTNDTTVIEYRLPDPGNMFLRISDNPFTIHSCPVAGTDSDSGITELADVDGFDHPLRGIITSPRNYADLDVTEPALMIGEQYFVQGCPIDLESGLFTGDSTNIVVIEIANELPDLVISEIKTLGRSPAALGRLFIRVNDINTVLNPLLRGSTFNYRVRIVSRSGDTVAESLGTAELQGNGGVWIIPGANTPGDLTDDIRIPDDGAIYEVNVHFNNSVTSITIPEANHFNNSFRAMLQARPKPLVLGIDNISVVENCDAISPGDWLMLFQLTYRRGGTDQEYRLVSNGTSDVDDNATYDTKIGISLTGTNIHSGVRVKLGFVDCDYDAFTGFVLPVAGIAYSSALIARSCGGEEAYEIGGLDDFTGWAETSLGGVTVDNFVSRTATASEDDCGPRSFTAEFKLMTQEQAAEQGYPTERIRKIP